MKVGKVTHYYNKAGVAILELEGTLKVGDNVKFQGHGADFEQPVIEMQINHKQVEEASKGEVVGFKMAEGAPEVKEGTEVLKV
jgi:translation elongation factor EF-1alpha